MLVSIAGSVSARNRHRARRILIATAPPAARSDLDIHPRFPVLLEKDYNPSQGSSVRDACDQKPQTNEIKENA
jgi:hypothetical protein